MTHREGRNAAALCASAAQMPRQAPGVHIGHGHRALLAEVRVQGERLPKVGRSDRQVSNDESGSMDAAGLDVFGVDPVIADVGVGQRDDLAPVTRIGQDFLIAGERGVEHHLASGRSDGANRDAPKDGTVRECENGRRQVGQQGKLRFARTQPPRRRLAGIASRGKPWTSFAGVRQG